MPRVEQTELEREFTKARWMTFGSWLRQRRLITGLTQEQVAKLVGVTRRQWVRYEQGAKMLKKRMRAAARALNVPYNTMLDRAGFDVLPRRNDIRGTLCRIGDHLKADFLDFAILELLKLNDRIRDETKTGTRYGRGVDATHFAEAIILLDRIRPSLSELAVRVLDARNDSHRNQSTPNLQIDPQVISQCVEALREETSRHPRLVIETF